MFGSSPMLPPGILPQVPTLAPSDSGFYSHGNPSSVQVKIVIFMFFKIISFRILWIVALWLWIVSQILVENVVLQEQAMLVEDCLQMLTCQTLVVGAA